MVHTAMLRADGVTKELFTWKDRIGSQSNFIRFLGKFTNEGNDRLFTKLMRQW